MGQFNESNIKRDDSGRFAEKPPAPEAGDVQLGNETIKPISAGDVEYPTGTFADHATFSDEQTDTKIAEAHEAGLTVAYVQDTHDFRNAELERTSVMPFKSFEDARNWFRSADLNATDHWEDDEANFGFTYEGLSEDGDDDATHSLSVQIIEPPEPDEHQKVSDLGMAVGEEKIVLDYDHDAPELGNVVVGRDEQGYYASGESTVYLGASVPAGADPSDPDEYMADNYHRLVSFAQDNYGATVVPTTENEYDTVQFRFRTQLDYDTDISTVGSKLSRDTQITELNTDLEDEGEDGGPTEFARYLTQHMVEADEAAKHPRNGVAPGGAFYSQADLDYSVRTARESNETAKRISKPEARTGFTIVSNEDAAARGGRGMPNTSVYESNAWDEPKERPMLPWRPPSGVPIATVDLDGHVTMIDRKD